MPVYLHYEYILESFLCINHHFSLSLSDHQVDAHVDTLVSEQAGYMLQDAGLAQVYGILQQHQPHTQGPLVQLLPPDKLKQAMVRIQGIAGRWL